MEMEILELGLLRTNCYLIWDDKTHDGVILDPGDQANKIMNRLGQLDFSVRGIVLTHRHFDHVGAVAQLREVYDCPVYAPAGDVDLPADLSGEPIPDAVLYQDGDVLSFGSVCLHALCTPGHTPGSSCLRVGNWLFSGDTLFRGSCGRTDFPGGDWREMYRSLKRLGALEGDLFVYPGHGEATTLEHERKNNPYLQEAMRR